MPTGLFKPAVAYQVGSIPFASLTADFNGDGRPDLAVANQHNSALGYGTLSILLGNGDGTFRPQLSYPGSFATHITGLAAGDVNLDGKIDLAFTEDGGGWGSDANFLLGNGDGTFRPGTGMTLVPPFVGGTVQGVTLADFNGDGKPDLAAGVDYATGLYLGNGDGTFQAGMTVANGFVAAPAADVNLDGRPDLITFSLSNHLVFVSLSNGDGTFQSPASLNTGSNIPLAVGVADVTGDNRPDVLVPGADANNNGVFLTFVGNGNGTFQAPTTLAIGPSAPTGATVADFTGDGKADVALAVPTANVVDVLPGNGNGTYQAAQAYAAGNDPICVSAADFDGDGWSDLAAGDLNGNAVSVLLNNTVPAYCLGNFLPQTTVATGSNPNASAVGDFNGDGVPDLISADTASQTVSVSLANGDGTFRPRVATTTGPAVFYLATGDFNNDGRLDAAAVSPGQTLYILLGNGDGTFQPARTTALSPNAGYGMSVADFTGDGVADVMVGDRSSQAIADLLVGQANGNFLAASPIAGGGGTIVGSGDANGDGLPDLVFDTQSGQTSVLLGNGDGTFQTVTFGGAYGLVDAVLADVNADGKPDLEAPSIQAGSPNGVRVFLGNGNGTFQPAVIYPGDGYCLAVAAADFNGDGAPDLALANDSNKVDVLFNNGNGTFRPYMAYAVGSRPIAVAAADFNHDGCPDLVATNYFANSFSVLPQSTIHLAISAPASATAGTAFLVTVSVADSLGNPYTSYTGTVHFGSTDTRAVLPADYTFQAADHGTHFFSATLKTAGNQSISVTDMLKTRLTTGACVTVSPGAISSLVFSGPTTAAPGTPFSETMSARDAFNNIVANYRGTVHFTSNDAQAVLPSDYTFTAADNGAHVFSFTLNSLGSRWIKATDTANGTPTGTVTMSVYAGPTRTFQVLASTHTPKSGSPFSVQVTALDALGRTDTTYRGRVHFSSSDQFATLPADYTFTAADAGRHVFTVTLRTTGTQTVAVMDTANSLINGSVRESVVFFGKENLVTANQLTPINATAHTGDAAAQTDAYFAEGFPGAAARAPAFDSTMCLALESADADDWLFSNERMRLRHWCSELTLSGRSRLRTGRRGSPQG